MTTRKHVDSNDQSGSTGRDTGAANLDPGKNTGQDRYGQSGLGGKPNRKTIGQQSYQKSGDSKAPQPGSNQGSGTAEDESEQGKTKPRTNRP